jgi:hypothetical protein
MYDLRYTTGRTGRKHRSNCDPKSAPHAARESGVALIITLILLAVITFMAVTFLVISTSERKAVSVTTDQAVARLAADSGTDRAEAEIMARIFANSNNFFIGDFVVSTNYINTNGFLTAGGPNGFPYTSLINVNYFYPNGAPLTGNDRLQNIANLFYNARVPVLMTNPIIHANEFRYYVDENRNGVFDATGIIFETNSLGLRVTNVVVGDPQWIGLLERPGFPHSPSNYFTARIAWLVIPASKTLDINYIHNDASFSAFGRRGNTMPPALDGFRRDQGAGTYEINLAAFLNDLNTNLWPSLPMANGYNYVNNLTQNNPNAGYAFDDAFAILRYRYGGSPLNLLPIPGLGVRGARAFFSDGIDEMLSGPIQTNLWWTEDPDLLGNAAANLPWPGIDSTNHFFSIQELFDKTKIKNPPAPLPGFVDRLLLAGTNGTDSYDRSTFYRILEQLGTDSSPEPAGRININFDNMVQKNATGVANVTNFYAWNPVDFFTNAAIRLLANAGYTAGTGSTNLLSVNGNLQTNIQIQVWPTNFYTPSVHRLFQVAANLYDATTNRSDTLYPHWPSAFRPLFRRDAAGRVYIVGYREEINDDLANQSAGIVTADPVTGAFVGNIPLLGTAFSANERLEPLVWGIPVVVGAKKGWPNFNQFAMQTQIQVTRKLEFRRPSQSAKVNTTNQMYIMGVSNLFGLEGWNSYFSAFPRPLRLTAVIEQTGVVTNENGVILATNTLSTAQVLPLNANSWVGFTNANTSRDSSFLVPIYTNNWVLTNSQYMNAATPGSAFFKPLIGDGIFENPSQFPIPRWWLNLRTRVRFILVDTTFSPGRIVDYVTLSSVEPPLDITATLEGDGSCGTGNHWTPSSSDGAEWCTNRAKGVTPNTPTFGILNQTEICSGAFGIQNVDWKNFVTPQGLGVGGVTEISAAETAFLNEFTPNASSTNLIFYAPFNPTRSIYYHTSWEANDPLVHYTIGDLMNGDVTNRVELDHAALSTVTNLGRLNKRYEPWGATAQHGGSSSSTKFDLTVKDPQVTRSDDWDFPTNKFPNPGFIGRVHRGSPWQTVYLKSATNTVASWQSWTGNRQTFTNVGQITGAPIGASNIPDAFFSLPSSDWRILDLFTTALNDNVTRGRLSINQTNLAAWSAVLSGVNVLTNGPVNNGSTFIQPAGIYNPAAPPPLVQILNDINNTRTNFPNGAFQRLGDILATASLTLKSPYLNLNYTNRINDAMYERIPQQILGLLQCDPAQRFVIYSYGQALKPAEHSLVTSGQYFGLCTNYQVTAETVTRTVVRIEGGAKNPKAVVESFNVLPPD